jgi:phage repressor protein C with HTH and peptisase S24 domain
MSRLRDAADHNSDHPPGTGADKLAFVHRLQVILTQWPSADRLARAMGVSPSAFRKWLKGEAEPSRERLIALAHAAGVGVAWLAEGEGPEPSFETNGAGRRLLDHPGEQPDWNQFVILPHNGPMPVPSVPAPGTTMQNVSMQGVSGSSVSGSSGSGKRESGPTRYLAVRQDWVRTVCGVDPEHLALDVAVDESMAPTIKPHDTVLLDTTEREISGNGIYVLDVGNQRQIRRVQRRHDGSLVLISDNHAYLPDIVENDSVSTIVVLGRVVWVGGTVS